jgi:hypothetical protein
MTGATSEFTDVAEIRADVERVLTAVGLVSLPKLPKLPK